MHTWECVSHWRPSRKTDCSVKQLRKFQVAMDLLSLWSWEPVRTATLWEQELMVEFPLWLDLPQKQVGGAEQTYPALSTPLRSLSKEWTWEQTDTWPAQATEAFSSMEVNLCMYYVYAYKCVVTNMHPHIHTDIHHMLSEKALQATQAWTTWRTTEAKGIWTPGCCSACGKVSWVLAQSTYGVSVEGCSLLVSINGLYVSKHHKASPFQSNVSLLHQDL